MSAIPNIIAICGYKRSGKDTVANFIVENYGYEHYKLAAPLKECIQQLFGFTQEEMEGNLKEEVHDYWKTSPRIVMDYIGTHIFQYEIQKVIPDIKRNFWINNLINRSNIKNDVNKKIVISDLRFEHEYNELMKYNTLVIKVVNPKIKMADLSSEKECDNLKENITLVNNGSEEELYKAIHDVLCNVNNMYRNWSC